MMNYSLDTLFYGMQFRRLLEQKMEPLAEEYGLYRIDMMILFYLSHLGERDTSSDIMKLNMFTRGHISQALSRLQKKGYIRMEQDVNDRRCTHNFLMPAAMEIVKKVDNGYQEIRNIILKDTTDEEMKILVQVAQKVNKNINNGISF